MARFSSEIPNTNDRNGKSSEIPIVSQVQSEISNLPSISRQDSQFKSPDDLINHEKQLNITKNSMDFEENIVNSDNNDAVEKEKVIKDTEVSQEVANIGENFSNDLENLKSQDFLEVGNNINAKNNSDDVVEDEKVIKYVEKSQEIVNIAENIGPFDAQQCGAIEQNKAATGTELFVPSVSENADNNDYECLKSSDIMVEKNGQSLKHKMQSLAQESCDNKSKCANQVMESPAKIQGVLGSFEGNLQPQKVDKSNNGIRDELENDKIIMGMSGFVEESDNIEKLTLQNDYERQDLSEMIKNDTQTRSESPTASLLTSGYGTIRSEKQNMEDDRLTINEFDKDSLYSFGICEQEAGEFHSLMRNDGFGQELEGHILAQDEFWDGTKSENSTEREEEEGRVEAQLCLGERESTEEEEDEGNRDVKFIDSKVDPRMFQDWEGNLRPSMGASCLEERLADLHLSTAAQHESENEDLSSHSESPSSESLSEGAFESYVRGLTRSHSDSDIRPKPKSFIRPVLGPTGPKKTDPVAKYFQYKQLWDMFKMPGENDRKALRWEIRERLAYQPPPPKPRKVLAPNTYTVPTEKKRSALRWEIRNDLATGNLPHSYNYRF